MSLSLKIVLIVLALFVPFCQCTNTLTVTSGGNPINNDDTVDVVEEEDFNFTCSASNDLAEIALTVVPVIEVPGDLSGSTRNFYLLNVQRDLTGTEFTCTDGTDTIRFTLNVLFAVSYSFSNDIFMRFEGENFFTDVTVEANPEPSGVTWTKDGEILSNDDNIVITSTSITITNLKRSDNGTYTITSDNGIGEGSGSFDLIVYYGPELTNGNNESTIDLTLTEGDTLFVDCSVSESNPTDYTIMLTLNSDDKMTITNQPNYMVTNSVTAADSGRYTCTVSTSVDFATLNYDVTVRIISPTGTSTSTVITTTITMTITSTTTTTTMTVSPSQTGDGSAAGFTSASLVLILVATFSVLFA